MGATSCNAAKARRGAVGWLKRLNQLIRTFSIELAGKRRQAICVGLHPGTVDSELSRPFQGAVADGQLSPPDLAAWRLLSIIDQLKPGDSGRVIAWDGTAVAA